MNATENGLCRWAEYVTENGLCRWAEYVTCPLSTSVVYMKAFEKNSQVDCEIEMAVTVQGVLGAAIDASICSLPQPQLPQWILWVRHDQTGLTNTTSSGG